MIARVTSIALLTIVALYIALTFGQHGISNDEWVQHTYGQLLFDYYASGLTDMSAFHYKDLYLYGGLFDLIAATLERLLPMNVWDMRHLLSALFGLAGLVAIHRLTRHLLDDAAACIAVALLMLTGAWSGALFTHTKDIPFAACMAWATYCITLVVQRLPAPPLGLVLRLGLAIGCAFGLRVGAVFAVMALGLSMLAASTLAGGDARARLMHLGRSVRALLPAVPVALALIALFWPWAAQAPGNLLKALTTFSHVTYAIRTVLDGEIMAITAVPRSYLPIYLAVRQPELTLAGLLGGLLLALPRLRGPWRPRLPWLPVVLAALLPLALAVLTRPALYNGIRHFTFLLPPLAILAAAGLHALWQHARRSRIWAAAFLALCLLGALDPLAAMARLHPYHYVNYNRLAGGFEAAVAGRWEADYWSDGVREATRLLRAYLKGAARPAEPWQVAVCADPVEADAWLGPDFIVTRDWVRADFFISTTHMDCDSVLAGRIIGQVARAGLPLTLVKDRRALAPDQRRVLR
jgi:4-amino-4-deoxy-L-arabinose transferase-like glycosyltransferase